MRMSSLANCPPVAISSFDQANAISAAAGRLRPVRMWNSAVKCQHSSFAISYGLYSPYSAYPLLSILPVKDPRTLLVNVRGAILGGFNNRQKKEAAKDEDSDIFRLWNT